VGRSATLADLIGLAFGLKDPWLLRSSVIGGPQWVVENRNGSQFALEAVAGNPASVTKAELQQMLQALLAERFKLKVSWRTTELLGHVMYPAKDGAKLPSATDEEELKNVPRKLAEGGEQRVITGKASMAAFLEFLVARPPLSASGRSDKTETFIDRTDLKGLYSFNLSYTVPPVAVTPDPSGRRGGGGDSIERNSPAYLKLRDALEEQLGLRLEQAKVPVDFVVIEEVHMPTPN
jgi:uncharacterized protein (TIGR03435 family)